MAGRRANNDGSLFQRKTGRQKGKWIAKVPLPPDENGKIKQVPFMFKTQEEARVKLNQAINDLAKGRAPVTKNPRLGVYLDEWLENHVKTNMSANTYERYKSAVKVHIEPDAISKMVISDIRVGHLHDLFNRRAKAGAKGATLFNVRATLSAALQQAVRDERIHDNPVRKTTPPKQAEVKIKYLNPAQVKLLAKACAGSDIGTLVLTALYTGMRLSELTGLTWDNVDFKRNTITVAQQLQRHDKTFALASLKTRGGRRTLKMDPVADQLKALKGASMLREQPEDAPISNLVFPAPSGHPYHRRTVLERTNELLAAAELPQLGFHALRHTCASLLINGGADALRVQRQLGHSSVRMTLETYSHLFEERLDGNIDILRDALA